MGAVQRCRLECCRSTEYTVTVLIYPILKGSHKCMYYPIGNANGLEVEEILSQNTLLRL